MVYREEMRWHACVRVRAEGVWEAADRGEDERQGTLEKVPHARGKDVFARAMRAKGVTRVKAVCARYAPAGAARHRGNGPWSVNRRSCNITCRRCVSRRWYGGVLALGGGSVARARTPGGAAAKVGGGAGKPSPRSRRLDTSRPVRPSNNPTEPKRTNKRKTSHNELNYMLLIQPRTPRVPNAQTQRPVPSVRPSATITTIQRWFLH